MRNTSRLIILLLRHRGTAETKARRSLAHSVQLRWATYRRRCSYVRMGGCVPAVQRRVAAVGKTLMREMSDR